MLKQASRVGWRRQIGTRLLPWLLARHSSMTSVALQIRGCSRPSEDRNVLPALVTICCNCLQVRMEHDDKGEWGEVMFVPAGALTQPEALAAEQEQKGKGRKKGRE